MQWTARRKTNECSGDSRPRVRVGKMSGSTYRWCPEVWGCVALTKCWPLIGWGRGYDLSIIWVRNKHSYATTVLTVVCDTLQNNMREFILPGSHNISDVWSAYTNICHTAGGIYILDTRLLFMTDILLIRTTVTFTHRTPKTHAYGPNLCWYKSRTLPVTNARISISWQYENKNVFAELLSASQTHIQCKYILQCFSLHQIQ